MLSEWGFCSFGNAKKPSNLSMISGRAELNLDLCGEDQNLFVHANLCGEIFSISGQSCIVLYCIGKNILLWWLFLLMFQIFLMLNFPIYIGDQIYIYIFHIKKRPVLIALQKRKMRLQRRKFSLSIAWSMCNDRLNQIK